MSKVRQLREARGWTLQHLGDVVGTSKQVVQKLETGATKMTIPWLIRLAKAFDVPPSELLPGAPGLDANPSAPRAAEMPPGAFSIDMGPRDLPVRGVAQGGVGIVTLDGDPIEFVYRPPQLIGQREAFGLYVTGESMGEVLTEGTLLYVSPRMPVRSRDLVVIVKTNGDAIVKRLIRQTQSAVTLREYYPEIRDFQIERGEIAQIMRVVGTMTP